MLNLVQTPFSLRMFRDGVGFAWPDVDILETENNYVFSFEIPGALKEDIKIWIDKDILTVTGEKKAANGNSQKVLFTERNFGRFERIFRLPELVDRNNVKAEFVNGVLVLTIPKAPEAKPKEININ